MNYSRVHKDARNVASSVYRINAPYAQGYAYNPHINNKEVATGEYVSNFEEATEKNYTFYLDFKTGKIRKTGK